MTSARFIKTMCLVSGVCLVSLLAFTAVAQTPPSAPPDRNALLTAVRRNTETADFRATGRLVHVTADGSRTTYKIGIKGHWFPDGLRLLYEVKAPAEARVQLLVRMAADGTVKMEALHPGTPSPSPLAAEHRRDSLLGTDFSFEDLVDSQLFWKGQTLQDPAKYGARDCFVLKSVPSAADHSQYESVTSWIDEKISLPIHVIKTIRATGEQRDFTYEGLRQTAGVWSATQIRVKTSGASGYSLIILERGSPKAKLLPKDFELGQPFTGDD